MAKVEKNNFHPLTLFFTSSFPPFHFSLYFCGRKRNVLDFMKKNFFASEAKEFGQKSLSRDEGLFGNEKDYTPLFIMRRVAPRDGLYGQ